MVGKLGADLRIANHLHCASAHGSSSQLVDGEDCVGTRYADLDASCAPSAENSAPAAAESAGNAAVREARHCCHRHRRDRAECDLDYWRRHCYAARPGKGQPPHIRRRRPAGLTPPHRPRTAADTNSPVGPRPQTLPTCPSVDRTKRQLRCQALD